MIHLLAVDDGGDDAGTDEASGLLFSYVDLEERIPAHHRLRKVRLDLPGKCGEHQLRNQEVFYEKREQTDAGISA
ncbi:hypothetical protein [Paracoccus yeei]|uniref:hypothetical protein n=1 Tax=Paracoccus yeei TaxID=147645 RepID=UPI00056876AD|nr:hypothetical protein [Paracoccus yeei]OWJ93281.1 hypothetical protein CDV54_11880 [Paracoccus yeei]